MKWRDYENVKGQYQTDVPDKTIMWAQSKGWGFRGEAFLNLDILACISVAYFKVSKLTKFCNSRYNNHL
jgi:hypothetical protein